MIMKIGLSTCLVHLLNKVCWSKIDNRTVARLKEI